MTKGKFLVIDGTDGSGKATQTELLIQRMRAEGHAIETISFPQYERPTGRVVKMYLDGEFGSLAEVGPKSASAIYAEDRYDASPRIRAWLDAGVNVVANRYVASNMGHQGAKIADAEKRRDFFAWLDRLEYGIFDLPHPDLNIILFVPPEIGQRLVEKRGTTHDIHEQSLEHLQAASRTYLEIAALFPGFARIDCVENGQIMSRETIHEMVWWTVQPLLGH